MVFTKHWMRKDSKKPRKTLYFCKKRMMPTYQARNTRHGIRGGVWDVEGGKEKGERGNDETGR
jgi:hypothetical protein